MPCPARHALPGFLAASVIMAGASTASFSQPTDTQTVVSVASGVDDLSVLVSADASDDARFEAAKRLVVKSDERTGTAISAALRDGSAPATQRAIARAIVAVDPGSPRYAQALRDSVATASTAACLSDLLTALNSAPGRPSVAAAMARYLDASTPTDMRSALSNALVRWTGCDECAARGVSGWREWWTRAESLDNDAWNIELARNFRTRAQRLARENDTLLASVVDLYTALYGATPQEQRSAVIASMLRDTHRQVNQLGLDLASRTLLNAQPLGPGVASAAMLLLASDQEDIRASAARLIENLGAPITQAAVVEALDRESSPRVAAPLLRLSSRDPANVPVTAVLRWLRAPEPAGSAAADAVLALHTAGLLERNAARDALSTILDLEPTTMTASQARVLAALGGPEDRAAIRLVVAQSTNAGARRSGAIALATNPDETDFLLDAAANDPAVYEGAARAIAMHRPTASGFLELMHVAPRDAGWIGPSSRTLVALPSDQRLTAVRAVQDLAKRDELLSAALQEGQSLNLDEARELQLLQAETRLDRNDGEGALAAANAALRDAQGNAGRAERVRFYALVMIGRLDDALAVTPGDPIEYWLEALRRCGALPHGPDVFALVDEHFASNMNTAQSIALRDLRRQMRGDDAGEERGEPSAPGDTGAASPEGGESPDQIPTDSSGPTAGD